jgi:hypothetical protein
MAAIPTVQAAAILQLYTERIRPNAIGATLPIGYYNYSDPTLISSSQTQSTPFSHDGHEDIKVTNSATYQSDTAVNKGKVLSVCATAPCASAPDNEGHSSASASGHADVQNLNVGGYTSADNYGQAAGALATSHSTVTAKFQVSAGSSGLADGTLIDLNWKYHLEGSTSINGLNYPYLSSATADVGSYARIVNPNGTAEGDDILAGVLFDLQLSLGDLFPTGSSPTTGFVDGHQSWNAWSNTGFDQNAYVNYYQEFVNEGGTISRSVSVDSKTGILGLDYVPFQASIGQWLNITLDLNLFSQTGAGASQFNPLQYGSTYNDYFNTLLSNIEFGAGYEGLGLKIQFDQPTSDGAAAPEPGTLVAGLGLTAMALLLRRKIRA